MRELRDHLRAGKVNEHGTSGSQDKGREAKLPIVHAETTFGEDQQDICDDDNCSVNNPSKANVMTAFGFTHILQRSGL